MCSDFDSPEQHVSVSVTEPEAVLLESEFSLPASYDGHKVAETLQQNPNTPLHSTPGLWTWASLLTGHLSFAMIVLSVFARSKLETDNALLGAIQVKPNSTKRTVPKQCGDASSHIQHLPKVHVELCVICPCF